ncbi:MAG TPA: SPOR domain-containing protein, partial [Draconibacterium sp.]|nr:SPOR domain-containing protein [Draconibacterium sp.]
LILLILTPLLVVAGFFLLKDSNGGSDNKIIQPAEITKEVPLEQNLPVIDSSATDSITPEKQDTLLAADTTTALNGPIEEVVREEIQDSIRYYLVAGSFSVKENAENYLIELQNKGYDPFHVGKKGQLFIIGINSYKTFKEAETAKARYMEENPGSEAWVYRK